MGPIKYSNLTSSQSVPSLSLQHDNKKAVSDARRPQLYVLTSNLVREICTFKYFSFSASRVCCLIPSSNSVYVDVTDNAGVLCVEYSIARQHRHEVYVATQIIMYAMCIHLEYFGDGCPHGSLDVAKWNKTVRLRCQISLIAKPCNPICHANR